MMRSFSIVLYFLIISFVFSPTEIAYVDVSPYKDILAKPKEIDFDVPFTSQAPFGNWDNSFQQYGCEEASALMAMRWAKERDLTKEDALKEIIASSQYELNSYGEYHDTSAEDTAERILRGYFQYNNIEVRYGITVEDIKNELWEGNILLVPVNGQKLGNQFYTPPGPREHMIVVHGYDAKTEEFIVNDPGTRMGNRFRYTESVLDASLEDYPTGFGQTFQNGRKAMIIIRKDL